MKLHWEFDFLPERAFQRVGRRMTLEGKSSPPPPDYTPLATASKEAAEIGAQLGREQLAENKRQYELNTAALSPVLASQLAAQQQQMTQGKDYYDYNVNTFRPLEQGLVADATAFNTAAAKEQFAATAAADMQSAQANQEAQQARALASMGVNPNSGKALAVTGLARVQNAADRAGATTRARVQADQLGWAKRLDAAGLGRGLAGASTAAYGSASQSGNGATGTQMAPSGQYMNGIGAGNGTIMSGQNARINGLGTIAGLQSSNYNAGLAADANSGLPIGQLAMAGATLWKSDRRLKTNISRVGVAVNGLNLYEFEYRGEPGKRYRGVMADEVMQVNPDAVITRPDGFMMVNYDKLGLEMVEV